MAESDIQPFRLGDHHAVQHPADMFEFCQHIEIFERFTGALTKMVCGTGLVGWPAAHGTDHLLVKQVSEFCCAADFEVESRRGVMWQGRVLHHGCCPTRHRLDCRLVLARHGCRLLVRIVGRNHLDPAIAFDRFKDHRVLTEPFDNLVHGLRRV